MRHTIQLLAAVVGLTLQAPAFGQGTFQNLNFEQAVIVPVPDDSWGRVEFASAFPGWIGYVGGVQQDLVLYNNTFLSSSGLGILQAGYPEGVIDGNFSAVLQAGYVLGTEEPANTTLAQTSLVPMWAESLRFTARTPSSLPHLFAVTLGGQTLALSILGTSGDFTLYGADIHSRAGQTAELAFTVFARTPPIAQDLYLDSIEFSDQPVPEPSVLSLLVVGGLMGWRFRRK